MGISPYLKISFELIVINLCSSCILLFQEELAIKSISVFRKNKGQLTIKNIWKISIGLAIVQSLVITLVEYLFLHGINIYIRGMLLSQKDILLICFLLEIIAISCINFSSIADTIEIAN